MLSFTCHVHKGLTTQHAFQTSLKTSASLILLEGLEPEVCSLDCAVLRRTFAMPAQVNMQRIHIPHDDSAVPGGSRKALAMALTGRDPEDGLPIMFDWVTGRPVVVVIKFHTPGVPNAQVYACTTARISSFSDAERPHSCTLVCV